jgi:hypothetical protein
MLCMLHARSQPDGVRPLGTTRAPQDALVCTGTLGTSMLHGLGANDPIQSRQVDLSEGSFLSPGKRLHHQRSSRHAMVPLSDTSPRPEG